MKNPNRDYASQHWYEPSPRDYDCNQHPRAKNSLVKALSIHTGMSAETASNMIDRLRHLSYCIGEPETITLFRLQAGKNQEIKLRDALGAPIEDS